MVEGAQMFPFVRIAVPYNDVTVLGAFLSLLTRFNMNLVTGVSEVREHRPMRHTRQESRIVDSG